MFIGVNCDMGRKSTEKKRNLNPEKRREIAMALIPSLEGGGISGLTMDDIAARLGKSKATIYKYFRSQEELLDLALSEKLEEIRGFVPIMGDSSLEYVDRYRKSLEHLSRCLEDVSTNFLRDIRKDFPPLWEKISFFQSMARMVLRGFYQEGLSKNLIRDVHPSVLVLTDQAVFNALLDPQFLEENSITLQEAFEAYFQMKFYGLLKGEEMRAGN